MWVAIACADESHWRHRRTNEALAHERPYLAHGDDEAVERIIMACIAVVMIASIFWQCASFWFTTVQAGGKLVRDEGENASPPQREHTD